MLSEKNKITPLETFFLQLQIEGKSEKTLEAYHFSLNSFLNSVANDINEVSTNDIRRYILSLKEKGYKNSTIATYFKRIRAFFNFLVAEGMIEVSPISSLKPPKEEKTFPSLPSEEDISLMLKLLEGKSFETKRNKSMLLLFLDTGIRVSELIGLTLDDVSLATYSAKVKGKGGKERIVHFGGETAKALSNYLKIRGFLAYENTFFVSRKSEPLGRHAVGFLLRTLAKRAGIKKKVSPHTLRHLCATLWIKNGGDTVSLRRQLGHSSEKLIDVYVNLVGRDLKEAHAKYSPVARLLAKKRSR